MPGPQHKPVILVDDDPSMLNLLARLLEIEGFQVLPLRSPSVQSLFEVVASHNPFAIILDVHLEGQNGLALLKSIRASSYSSTLKILMTSGEDVRSQCFEAGADGFLLKPYMPTDLITWLQSQYQFMDNKES